MDYQHILALVASLLGQPGDIAAGTPNLTAAVTHIACPRPYPVNEIDGQTITCGTVQVPEDHDHPEGKKIALKFMIMKSHSQYPEPDPLVYLDGGPGGSAFGVIGKVDRGFAPWRRTRDIVFWDQRSAGISGHSVNCYKALSENAVKIAKGETLNVDAKGDPIKDSLVSKCLGELESSGIDIAKYNTTQDAKDIPVVMAALGYPTYNLYGISFGSKLALETMRVAPQGIRSVIIDGVAPSWVHLYNSFTVKTDEAIENVVEQCRADPVCNKTYPDLHKVIIETLHMAHDGKIIHQGKPVTTATIFRPFNERNGQDSRVSMTPYIPAFIYELHRGGDMPTVDMLMARNFLMPELGDDDVTEASASLPKEQRNLIRTLSDNVAISRRVEKSNANVVEELRDTVDERDQYGPVAVLFDRELEKALTAEGKSDPAKIAKSIADYVALQNIKPSRDALKVFVEGYTSGEQRARLLSLIQSMSEAEVAGYFDIIKRDVMASQTHFFDNMYLFNYACQEDIPYNSYEGYKKVAASDKYPYLDEDYDLMVRNFFAGCAPFKPQERENWHTPVASDIPTLSIGGLYDIQTPASWARLATEKLTNAQVFMIPEAGHGAVIYQPCVADIGVAFTNNPYRKLSDACPKSITINWHIPDWAKEAK
ncbi:hypothetical protein DK847_00210 [Aestuariivirga litoralis]|uniref:Proline iminopeptidase n=1 Tax=Aestuariivirga litoralis TaxID=2650924 RepID=A0A2W2BXV6_9HYPH|nr:alpha/beta hydrolase [Aestuariivirga litoralis]PZF78286.1 hypothetical protein DK847_00210 [Aestuariivirga litoralis]